MKVPTTPRGSGTTKPTPKKTAKSARAAVALDGKQRRYLRGLAHDLQAILQIGKAGATKALVAELDRALEAHELVKVRALRECPTDWSEIVVAVEKSIGASIVGKVGSVAILYRARSKNPTIVLPKSKAKPSKAPVPTSRKTTSE